LYKNELVEIKANTFAGINNLKRLSLSVNRIETLEPNAFANLAKLEGLCLGYNNLKMIGPEAFNGLCSLKNLTLEKNRIESLHPRAFCGLPQVECLYLSSNKLNEIDYRVFMGMSGLVELFLENNKINKISGKELSWSCVPGSEGNNRSSFNICVICGENVDDEEEGSFILCITPCCHKLICPGCYENHEELIECKNNHATDRLTFVYLDTIK
jgi:Leucine-rich repeat (LRR) protein